MDMLLSYAYPHTGNLKGFFRDVSLVSAVSAGITEHCFEAARLIIAGRAPRSYAVVAIGLWGRMV